jgi:outer membrane lipoprotein-sorting protein
MRRRMGDVYTKSMVFGTVITQASPFRHVKNFSCGLFCLFSISTFAQYPGYHPISDLPAFKKQFTAQSITVSTITSSFTQEKILSALTEKIISRGRFWFKRSDKVRIEYTEPFFFLMILNGDKMLMRDDQKENKINVNSNKLFQQINRIVIDCVQGTILDSNDFSVKVFEDDKTFLMEMTPSSKRLREFFETIVLTVEKKDYSAKKIEMNEPLGDVTTLIFTNKKLNEPVSDAIFTP